jgi:prolyl 4-hydroxylase
MQFIASYLCCVSFTNQLIFQFSPCFRKLNKIESEHRHMSISEQSYVQNPLNAFLLIKRLTYDIRQIPESIHKVTVNFLKNTQEITLPVAELDGAVIGLHRLQETYDLKSKDLANGVIENKKYRAELSSEDLLILAEKTANMSLTISDDYVKLARERNKDIKEYSELEILDETFKFYKFSAQYQKALDVLKEMIVMNPENKYYEGEKTNLELLLLFKEDKIEEKKKDELSGAHYTAPKEKLFYSYGCRGKIQKSIRERSELYCKYISNTPFTMVAPFKIEEANLNPLIVIFHEILSDAEIETIKTVTESGFVRAATISKNNTNHVTDIRTAQLHWAKDQKHPVFERLTKRVADMTGLNMKTAEDWQIQNYGIGCIK